MHVQFNGGGQLAGTLMRYGPLLNSVSGNTVEYLKDWDTDYVASETRDLGFVVLRGTAVILISFLNGMKEIEPPFG
ncbi:hypothetical protein BCR42DRAFT_453209 [Absidia repens]|uniref:Sm domain-containing protein n=1 Tax=Absidia repens TaxID=90262 RepID=A0A1X2IBB9_9FUNG|nr:hypothetical protein BCR42DRAFT_453209 [Absidia repens]